MTDALSGLPDAPPTPPAEAGSVLAEVWKNIFPWDDLNAKGPPERWLKLGPDILATLGVMSAQGPDRPRLLKTDALSRLQTIASMNGVGKVTQQDAAGQATVDVTDTSLYAPGSWVAIVPAAGASQLTNTQFYQVTGLGQLPGQITVAPNLNTPANPGDYVIGVPVVWIAGQSLNVQVGNSVNVSSLPAVTIAPGQSVSITSGTVNIGNTPSVTVSSGTVNIGNTPSVTVSSGTVNIGNTPTVILGTGSATVGAVSAINSTVTVAGTINIGNTPSVTVSSGTVTISSGTVTFTNAQIAVLNVSGTTLQVAQSQVLIGVTINGATNFALDPRWHAIGIEIISAQNPMTLSIKGQTTGTEYVPAYLQSFNAVAGKRFAFPLIPIDTTDDANLTVTCSIAGQKLIAILDAGAASEVFTNSGQSLSVQANTTPPPWQAPTTLTGYSNTLVSNGEVTLVSAVAGQNIYVFDLVVGYDAASGPISLNDGGSNRAWFIAGTLAPVPLRSAPGAPLGVGTLAKLHNFNAGNAAIRGHMASSQG